MAAAPAIFDPTEPGSEPSRRAGSSGRAAALTQRLGLHYVSADLLCIGRRANGKGWIFVDKRGRRVRDARVIFRLRRLAVPPAYTDVRYAADPLAHLQAVGRDAAGRLQYRYHARWEEVRELQKGRRLAKLADLLPRIRPRLRRHLASREPTREFAAAAVIELVAESGIRAGRESYARLNGTRGAATLLKSNVSVNRRRIALTFRSKGGKHVTKELNAPHLRRAIAVLRQLPGPRLFQFRAENGDVRRITAREVNDFLRELAGARISLKDFRTLLACIDVLGSLAAVERAQSERQRRRQVLEAVREAAGALANTPAICRKSYVHGALLSAFEDGTLKRLTAGLNGRSSARQSQVLAKIIAERSARL